MIMGAARTAMLATVQPLTRGEMALVVDRDTLVVASDATTPEQAWPGDPNKLGGASRQRKPAGVVDLSDWAPTRGRARRQVVAVHPAHGAPEQPAGLIRQGCRRQAGG